MMNVSTYSCIELGAQIRMVKGPDGEPLWVAKDIAEALDYTWNGAARIEHVPAEWRGVTSVVTPSGTQEMAVLKEQGLYFFLGRSDKPAALPFQRWLAGEVIPSIRKTGTYTARPRPEGEDREAYIRRTYKDWCSVQADTLSILGYSVGWMRGEAISRANDIAQHTGIDVLPRDLLSSPHAVEITWDGTPTDRIEHARAVTVGTNYINVTKWAETLPRITSKHLNTILADLGLQTQISKGMYSPTAKGLMFAGTATISGSGKHAGIDKVTGWNVLDQRLLDTVEPRISALQRDIEEFLRAGR